MIGYLENLDDFVQALSMTLPDVFDNIIEEHQSLATDVALIDTMKTADLIEPNQDTRRYLERKLSHEMSWSRRF